MTVRPQRPMPEKVGRYQLECLIGRGGMGEVYKAFDPGLDRTIAIKTIASDARDPVFLQRLYREASACGRLHHPGIVTVFDLEEAEGLVFIAMEYLDGESLADAIKHESLDLEAKLRILVEILEALEYAHGQGVIHRDVKPSNIHVLPDGSAKLLDFGLARVTRADALTVTGDVMGTPYYMSPEQLKGQVVDARTDVFAMGVVAYELLTNRKAFDGAGLTEVMLKVLSDAPPPMASAWSTAFPEIERIVLRAMAKSVDQRYATAAEMKEAIAAFLEESRDAIVRHGQNSHAATSGSGTPDTTRTASGTRYVRRHAGAVGSQSATDGTAIAGSTRRSPGAEQVRPTPLERVPHSFVRSRVVRWGGPIAALILVSVGAIVAAQRGISPDVPATSPGGAGENSRTGNEPGSSFAPPDPATTAGAPGEQQPGRQTGPDASGVNGSEKTSSSGPSIGSGAPQAAPGQAPSRPASGPRSSGSTNGPAAGSQVVAAADELSRTFGERLSQALRDRGAVNGGSVQVTLQLDVRDSPFQGTSGKTGDWVARVRTRDGERSFKGHVLAFSELALRDEAVNKAVEVTASFVSSGVSP